MALSLLSVACGGSDTSGQCSAGTKEPFERRRCGEHIECFCDGVGRVLRIETHEANAAHSLQRRRYRYEGMRLLKVDETRRGPNVSIEIEYDDSGRRVLLREDAIDAQGEHMLVERSFEYEDGRVVREHTSASSSLHIDYDLRNIWEGDLLVRREIDERRDGDYDFVEAFTYDDAGNRIGSEISDGKGQALLRCEFEHCPAPHRGCPSRCEVLDPRFDEEELRFD